MMFKATIAALAALTLIAGALYWRNDHLAAQLAAAQIRAQNAAADLSLARAALTAQSAYTARKSAIADNLARTEQTISRTEGADAPADPATVDFIRGLGLLAD